VSMIAFFPWLAIRETITVADYELRRWPDQLDGDPCLSGIERILSPYYADEHPVRNATILRSYGRSVDADLTAEEREAAFVFAECLALAGLSARRFFRHRYQNRDHFRLVIQSFKDDRDAIVIRARRRDGSSTDLNFADRTRFQKPAHVPLGFSNDVDVPLLESLLSLRSRQAGEEWDRVHEAMVGFNLANTDSDDMRESVEGVLMIGAFQQLFGCSRTNEDGLASALRIGLEPLHDRVPEAEPHLAVRAAELRNPTTIREMWIRDFYRLRNAVAHGRVVATSYRPVWSLRNHLLLGAYVFPLLVKKVAERAGAYVSTREDAISVDLFEVLAAEDHFAQDFRPDDPASHPWTRCMSQGSRFALERGLAGTGEQGGLWGPADT
jgi:hypothetical protein